MSVHLGTWPDLGNQSPTKSIIQILVFTLGRPLGWYPSAYRPKVRVACWGEGSLRPCTARVPDLCRSRWHNSGNSLLLVREYSTAGRCSSSCCRSATIDHPAPGCWSSARTSWFPCVLVCVMLGLVSLPCVGRPCAHLLCCLRSSQFRWFLFRLARSLMLVSGAGGGGGSRSLHPLVAVGLSHLQLGGARGTRHFCTCLQIYEQTCHWRLLGLFRGECGALLPFCFLGY